MPQDGAIDISGLDIDPEDLAEAMKVDMSEFKEEIDDEMKMVLNAFQPQFKSTSKNYKYFYRGQYSVMPELDDVVQSMNSRK